MNSGKSIGRLRSRQGVTLFELLVAMTLLVMVTAMLYSVLNVGIKFSDKGEITVTLSTEPAAGDMTDLVIKIADSGIIIPAELQENIFNAFVQLDNATTRKYSGTGLGLAVTKTLVERMQGKLSVTSPLRWVVFFVL